jgi:hypothetical protein
LSVPLYATAVAREVVVDIRPNSTVARTTSEELAQGLRLISRLSTSLRLWG